MAVSKSWFVVMVVLFVSACAPRKIATNVPGEIAADFSYSDLAAGERLRILVPLLRSGRYEIKRDDEKIDGTTITLRASDLIGYETSYYGVEGKPGGRVRLRFASALLTKDGKSVAETDAPTLPFALPRKKQYIRLLYLVRGSAMDHNMAIIGARDRTMLAKFTAQLKTHPGSCGATGDVFCAWVPVGIAVRAERPGDSD